MGLFDGLRDAATLRGYDTAAKKGDLEAQAAAVVAVNRLGTEGLQRIDPAKAQEVALKAMDRIAFTGTDNESNASAKSALEGWLTAGKVSPLSDSKNASEAEDRYGAAFNLSGGAAGKVSPVWDRMREREGFRAVMFENASESKLHDDVIFDACDYATKIGREGVEKYPADERAAYPAVSSVLRDRELQGEAEHLERSYAEHLRDQASLEASRAPFHVDAEDEAEWRAGEGPSDDAIQQWEDEGIARVTAEMAAELKTGEAAEAAFPDIDPYLSDDLNPYAGSDEFENQKYLAQLEDAEAKEAKPDRTPADDAAFSRSAAPSPDFRAALTAGTSGPARGPR